jgi:hypothetical protein
LFVIPEIAVSNPVWPEIVAYPPERITAAKVVEDV